MAYCTVQPIPNGHDNLSLIRCPMPRIDCDTLMAYHDGESSSMPQPLCSPLVGALSAPCWAGFPFSARCWPAPWKIVDKVSQTLINTIPKLAIQFTEVLILSFQPRPSRPSRVAKFAHHVVNHHNNTGFCPSHVLGRQLSDETENWNITIHGHPSRDPTAYL